jgi:hypothetical protein
MIGSRCWHDAGRGWRALEEKRNRHLKDLGKVLQAAGADAVGSLLVFLNLLECNPEGVSELGWLISSISRRMRTRLPTCLSVGLKVLLGMFSPNFIAANVGLRRRTAMP